MKIFFRVVFTLLLVAILGITAHINSKLYYQPEYTSIGNDIVNSDVLAELHYLDKQLHQGGALKMQQLFPEGFVFTNVIYGLAWCAFAEHLDKRSELYKEARTQIDWAWGQVNSETAKNTFTEWLPIPYGAYYTGWNTYLLGKKLSIEDADGRDTLEIILFKKQCDQIAAVISRKASPYPESYAGACWPADATVCVASLVLYDALFEPCFSERIKAWVKSVKNHCDSSGLMAYDADPETGRAVTHARGASSSLILCFLPEIDPVFSKQQALLYKENFLQYHMGLPGIREYLRSANDHADVDSGPIIFHIGAAATITGVRAMRLNGENITALRLRNTVEGFGFPVRRVDEKKYLFGKLLIADVFIAWVNTAEIENDLYDGSGGKWQWQFQLYSVAILLTAVFLFFRIWKIRFKKQKKVRDI